MSGRIVNLGVVGLGRAFSLMLPVVPLERIGVALSMGPAKAGLIVLIVSLWPEGADYADDDGDGDELTLIQSEGAAEGGIVLAAAAAEAFLDIRGAPMIITLPDGPALGASTSQ